MLSVKTNMLAENASRQLGLMTKRTAKNSEKLSSGYKINRAADDAAGLAISEKMRRQIRGLHQGALNIQDGIGYVQTADGALNEAHDILQRMNELSVKAANGTNTEEDRSYIDMEIQALKEELNRIFSTTSFNERLIWEPKEREEVGTIKKKAIEFRSFSGGSQIKITDANSGLIAKGDYTISADKNNGVTVSWTGYDGNTYTSTTSLEDLKKNQYLDITANGVRLNRINFSVAAGADDDMIVNALNGVTFSSVPHAYMFGRFEAADESPLGSNQAIVSGITDATGWNATNSYIELDYEAAIKAGHGFENDDDVFLEPANRTGGTNLASRATSGSNRWVFNFTMSGLGDVTATSSSIHYGAPDDWSGEYSTDGTVTGLTQAVEGSGGNPGLRAADHGGYVDIWFDLSGGGMNIGSFKIRVEARYSDYSGGVDALLDKINDAFSSGFLDFDTEGPYLSTANATFSTLELNEADIVETPVYGGNCNFFVEAGPEAGYHIDIDYESLNLFILRCNDTNTKTVEDAENAINEVKEGLKIINEQRAIFGAYQNRLERAYNINLNSEENVQYAEAQIRDTDVAELMVEYANQSILSQAGTSMLAQANQQPNYILQLLQ